MTRRLNRNLASDLKALSLFKGVFDTDFDLSRAPTRTEAVVILIRVLGKESEAQGGDWTQPFGDVAPWADKYIGYAYQEGLTKGVSDTEFGSGNANGTYDSKNDEYYLSTSRTKNDKQFNYFIQYSPNEKYDLFLSGYMVSSGFELLTDVYIVNGTTAAYFDYIFENKATGNRTVGKGAITKNSFSEASTVVFQSLNGSTNVSQDANLCSAYIVDTLNVSEYILSEYKASISIGDLGFDTLFDRYYTT